MSYREELLINQNKIKELDEQISKASKLVEKLERVNMTLKSSLIKEEQLLANSKWYLKAGTRLPYLEYQGSAKDNLMIKISEIINAYTFHYSFFLSEKARIQFDDNRVTLQFEDLKSIPEFVNKFKIVIDGSFIKDALHHLKQDALAIETICHQLQIDV